MQSRQAFVMDVRGGPRFQHALGAEEPAVVLWDRAERPLRDVLPDAPAALLLAIGPEGGLSDEEVDAAVRLDIPLASLGPNILRTETAAVVGATLVLARYGRLG